MLFLELFWTTAPLFLAVVSITAILHKEVDALYLAFWGGFLLDIVSVRPPGGTSLFFISWVFFILLYERKYEINSLPFAGISTLIGSFIFLQIFDYPNIFLQAIVSSMIGLLIFGLVKFRYFSSAT